MNIDVHHVWYADRVSYQPLALLAAVVLPWLLLETWRSRRNERVLRAAGAVEPPGDVYAWMRVAYPGMFAAMTLEGMLRPPRAATIVAMFPESMTTTPADLAVFHVLVLPGAPLVTSGPYRLMRHPNYVGLMGEIAGVALMMRAPFTGVVSAIVFGALLVARIRVEDRLLREAR